MFLHLPSPGAAVTIGAIFLENTTKSSENLIFLSSMFLWTRCAQRYVGGRQHKQKENELLAMKPEPLDFPQQM